MNTTTNMNRRNLLRMSGGAAALTASSWATGLARGEDADRDEDLLAEARARIEQHRKGEGTLAVRTAGGSPVPGARVEVQQVRHEFLFGCNLFRWGQISDPEREAAYRRRFANLLNFATLGFYWGAYEPRRGQPRYEYTDQAVDWCRSAGITCKGHPLAWDHPASSPRWLGSDFAEIQRLSTARVRDIVRRYKDKIDIWDVVNEPTDLTRFKNPMNDWARDLGAVPFTRLHLETARAANPRATLLVNDYRTDPAYRRILDQLTTDETPLFDAIGIQSHMHRGGWPLKRIWETCDAFASLQRPLHFTESTVVSGPRNEDRTWGPTAARHEAAQADYVPTFYTMLFAHPAVQALTWWDFSDDGAWQGAPAGWLRRDMSPKPVYERLEALIKRAWWTQEKGKTDENGEARVRAFFGTQRVTVTLPDKREIEREFDWRREGANRFELTTG